MSAPAIDPLEDVGRGGVPRDRYDRALLVPPEGGARRPYTSMSTLAKQLGSDYALHRWQLRLTAKGVGMSRELSALAGSSRYDTRIGEEDEDRNREEGKILDDVVHDAMELAGAHQKAKWGTAFHRYVEVDDPLGEPPEDMVGDIEAFRKALRKAGFQILDTEVFVVNEELGAAGSFDYLLAAPWLPTLAIGDSKTGILKLDQDEIQLWGYAGSVIYDRNTNERYTFEEKYGMAVSQEVAYTISTRPLSEETEIYPLDLVQGRESALLAKAVHARNSAVQKYYRKVKPLDLDTLGAENARRAMDYLATTNNVTRETLRTIHAEFKDVWTDELSSYGGKLLRLAKAAAA